jgi:hypothetical protein
VSSTSDAGLDSGGYALELTPSLRASVPLRPKLAFRGEAGVGAVYRWTWAEVDQTYVGRRTVTGSETTALVRLGLGLDWAVRPNVALILEPLSFGFDLEGNADWTLAAGATIRL